MVFSWFVILWLFFCVGYGDPRALHVTQHSFPTRRSSDLPHSLTKPTSGQKSRQRLPKSAPSWTSWIRDHASNTIPPDPTECLRLAPSQIQNGRTSTSAPIKVAWNDK